MKTNSTMNMKTFLQICIFVLYIMETTQISMTKTQSRIYPSLSPVTGGQGLGLGYYLLTSAFVNQMY